MAWGDLSFELFGQSRVSDEYVARRDPQSSQEPESVRAMHVAAMNREHDAWTTVSAPEDVFSKGGIDD